MHHDLVYRLAALLQLPPDDRIVDAMQSALKEKFSQSPSRDVLEDQLFHSKPLGWLVTYHIGLLIGKYPEWLVSKMDHNPARRVQVLTFLDGLSRQAPPDSRSDPRGWLIRELGQVGLKVSQVTVKRWLTGRGALQLRFRNAVSKIIGVEPEALPPASRGRVTPITSTPPEEGPCLHTLVWKAGARKRDEPQVKPWIEIAGEPDSPGFIFRILSEMDRHPGMVPAAADILSALEDPSTITWPITLKCAQVFDDVPGFALPSGAKPGERHGRIIMALARHGRPGSDQELTKWLLEALPAGRSRAVMATIHAWMSGRSNPQKDSITRIEKTLHLPIGTIWSGQPENAAEITISQVPSGFKSARTCLAPLGFSDLGSRIAMVIPIHGQTSLSTMAESLADMLMEKAGIDFPELLTLSWLTGQVRPSPLETEIIGAALGVSPGWLEVGTRVTSRRDRSIELREMASKLSTQMKSWRAILHRHGDEGMSDVFRTRLCVAMVIRGALKDLDATDGEIFRAAKYLMNMRFEMNLDHDGNIIQPPRTQVNDLAARCGVEAVWLAENKISEHSYVRHMLGQRQILI